jgi:hypothetical protein
MLGIEGEGVRLPDAPGLPPEGEPGEGVEGCGAGAGVCCWAKASKTDSAVPTANPTRLRKRVSCFIWKSSQARFNPIMSQPATSGRIGLDQLSI